MVAHRYYTRRTEDANPLQSTSYLIASIAQLVRALP